ncbi:hypothetical protein SAMN05216345_11580 [Cupriavidus sp. YR651]|uniref:hypothetical protein n=1 Tax=Cupriavidus sp. YR651 TaxID=1855315 RepID=UPI00088E2A42|nr:hypothetical protein [Cupriavidus sp. YR651]SDD76625.1 hypothetical protein SAMN05216345_11580 [Cupriavidus sp. YR651]
MKAADLSTFLSSVILGASVLVYAPVHAQDVVQHNASADSYGYVFHKAGFNTYTDGANGIKRPDPYTDGANGIKRPDPYTDGANGLSKRDPFTDGAHGSTALQLAGMDRTGVSAPPSHGAAADNADAA